MQSIQSLLSLGKTLFVLGILMARPDTQAQNVLVETDCLCIIDMKAYSWEDQYNMVPHDLDYLNPYHDNVGTSDLWELVKITFQINSDPWMFLSWDYNVNPDDPFRQIYGPIMCDDELVCIDLQGGRAYQSGPPYNYQFKVTCSSPDYNPNTQQYDLCE